VGLFGLSAPGSDEHTKSLSAGLERNQQQPEIHHEENTQI
jgi:hypothetical protein